ncbi:hypothetical protein [Zavarzinella formosa]|uniref:hypothetical protein n=1 Tax=Zavarzinella formosa TaxID=360055 RepID=UPI000378089E|nr:hypothetical protein [Zavarzinella formosa]
MTLIFPKHAASLHLEHNTHKAYYLTVKQSIEQHDHGFRDDDWVSEEQKQKAISTNECWTLQWYPDTPGGFCLLSAADLDVLLESALRGETESEAA